MVISNLVCDLDGTLIDSYRGIEASARYACESCLPERSLPSLREHIGPPIKEMFRRMFPDLPAYELDKLVCAFRREYDERGWRLCLPFADVVATLWTLRRRGVRLFVLTNKPAHATRIILDAAGILPLFTEVVSPDSATPSFTDKVQAAIALQEEHALAPPETALVGDGVDDGLAAAACRFTFLFANYGYGARSSSGRIIERFSDLLALPGDSVT